jgi:hypothetical protein
MFSSECEIEENKFSGIAMCEPGQVTRCDGHPSGDDGRSTGPRIERCRGVGAARVSTPGIADCRVDSSLIRVDCAIDIDEDPARR